MIDVAVAADGNMRISLLVTICSAAKHSSAPLRVWAFVEDFDQITRCQIAERFHKVGMVGSEVRWMEAAQLELPSVAFNMHHITRMAFARLGIPRRLAGQCGRLIYLDCDLLVTADLKELWALDVGANIIAAVRDIGAPLWGMPYGLLYAVGTPDMADLPLFNSGVMLIDVERWMAANVEKTAWAFAQLHKGEVGSDQDCLNYVLKGRWHRLDFKWNYPTRNVSMGCRDALSKSEQDEYDVAINSRRVVHFLGAEKPWKCFSKSHASDYREWRLQFKELGWLSPFRFRLWLFGVTIQHLISELRAKIRNHPRVKLWRAQLRKTR